MKKILAAAVVAALIASPALAAGKKSGFETIATQGASGKPANTKNSTTAQGDTTVVGPKGQVKQDKTANTTVSGPGNSTKMP